MMGYQRVFVNKDVTVVYELTSLTTVVLKTKTVNNVVKRRLKRSMKLKPRIPAFDFVACTNRDYVVFTTVVNHFGTNET